MQRVGGELSSLPMGLRMRAHSGGLKCACLRADFHTGWRAAGDIAIRQQHGFDFFDFHSDFRRTRLPARPRGFAARQQFQHNNSLRRVCVGIVDTIPPRSNVLLTEVLRLHLATAPMAEHGWIAALQDQVLAPAMAQLHAAPQRKWTVAELASTVAVSRSVLDQRFRDVLGRSPIRYLTEWRMHLADDLLRATQLGVCAVARRVGYESEAAFSRAFRRSQGSPPGAWRASQQRTGDTPP